MIVHIVMKETWDGATAVAGVFTSEDAAEAFIREEDKKSTGMMDASRYWTNGPFTVKE